MMEKAFNFRGLQYIRLEPYLFNSPLPIDWLSTQTAGIEKGSTSCW